MKYIFIFLVSFFLFIQQAEANRGCCSWHGGVCGCAVNGRTLCCDGSLSPSCQCR